jgi:hypothetical protein
MGKVQQAVDPCVLEHAEALSLCVLDSALAQGHLCADTQRIHNDDPCVGHRAKLDRTLQFHAGRLVLASQEGREA